MNGKLSPLHVNIIDRPGAVMPGKSAELQLAIRNLGTQGAVLDIFLDPTDNTIRKWCQTPRQHYALDPQQSAEVTFTFEIPVDAEAGSYPYDFVIDAPEHYPEDTPLQYRDELRVLLKEHTVTRAYDPSFAIVPGTNPHAPVALKGSEPLQFQVRVRNRSKQVDRFRLECPDLDDRWLEIRYPNSGLEGTGIVTTAKTLELNPGATGDISALLAPPPETLAGIYSPTMQLYSANQPDLVLLDLIYFEVLPNYDLGIELVTELGKVANTPGRYNLKLSNRGNVERTLLLEARGCEEVEQARYRFKPNQLRLFPLQEMESYLLVAPMQHWRRPLLGSGLPLDFKVVLWDAENYPLPKQLPEAKLLWKSRPWWQLVLLMLLILGLLATTIFTVWWSLVRLPSLSINNFAINKNGDRVYASWEIANANRLKELELKIRRDSQSPESEAFFKFARDRLGRIQIPENLKEKCTLQEELLKCSSVLTSAAKPGAYYFTLQASHHRPRGLHFRKFNNNKPKVKEAVAVAIAPKPPPEIARIRLQKRQFRSGEPITLSLNIKNPGRLGDLHLEELHLIVKKDSDSGPIETSEEIVRAGEIVEKFTDRCDRNPSQITCSGVSLPGLLGGHYVFELQGWTSEKVELKKATTATVRPEPVEVVSFLLNGRSDSPAVMACKPATLKWEVRGGDRVVVEIENERYEGRTGETILPGYPTEPSERAISIKAIDERSPDNRNTATIQFKIVPPPDPDPDQSSEVTRSRTSCDELG